MDSGQKIREVLKTYWGYSDFRPLQERAMACATQGRDSIVVLPTGGGKSLCFQAPAVILPGIAVVVSPLISLMKDQVDGLVECGVAAARLDSMQTTQEQRDVYQRLHRGELKLLYVAPERLVSGEFLNLLKRIELSLIAVDEAHCVSMWGHDFRPEYRQLGVLKTAFPGVAVHAYTATATAQVRDDIAVQLNLREPEVLVGSFYRPNLVYRVQPRKKLIEQAIATIERHRNESGIIYCIRRADVDNLTAQLRAKGYRAAPYHAGMADAARKTSQDSFINEKADVIVATVAFGMGIDKSNVRYVLHAGMPKSLEHYQQESGRAGRDGLEAECLLLYSGGDYGVWNTIITNNEPVSRQISLAKLGAMYSFCTGVTCRHRAILQYFGQNLTESDCGACDVCLGEVDCMDDSLVTAQKILSSVVRQGERFGGEYTAKVLTGSKDDRISEFGHHQLSTFGLLAAYSKTNVREWIEQLVGQGYAQKAGEFNVLKVTPRGWSLLKGGETPRLSKPVVRATREKAKKKSRTASSRAAQVSWEGVDEGLFEHLRLLRSTLATAGGIPAYMVFSDVALRGMARLRPATIQGFLEVSGVGEKKAKKYGKRFLEAIEQFCTSHGVPLDRHG